MVRLKAVWKDIPGYEGRYQASDMGAIRSVDRYAPWTGPRGRQYTRFLKGQELAQNRGTNGYLGVQLGLRNPHLTHRLIAETFLGPSEGRQVNHRNGDRSDNRLENLEWVTCSENHLHSYRELSRKEHAHTQPVTLYWQPEKFGLGLCERVSFESAAAAARALGVRPGSVISALNKQHLCKGWRVFRG